MPREDLQLEHSDILGRRNIILGFALYLPLTIMNMFGGYMNQNAPLIIIIAVVLGAVPFIFVKRYNKRLKEIRLELKPHIQIH